MMSADLYGLVQAAIGIAASGIVIARSEPILDRMSRATPMALRVGYWLLTLGGMATIWHLLSGYRPGWAGLMLLVGIAGFLLSDRRSVRREAHRWDPPTEGGTS